MSGRIRDVLGCAALPDVARSAAAAGSDLREPLAARLSAGAWEIRVLDVSLTRQETLDQLLALGRDQIPARREADTMPDGRGNGRCICAAR